MSSIIVLDSDEEENEIPAKKARLGNSTSSAIVSKQRNNDGVQKATKKMEDPKTAQQVQASNCNKDPIDSNGSVVIPKISSVQSMFYSSSTTPPLQLLATPPHTSSANNFNEQLMMSPNLMNPTLPHSANPTTSPSVNLRPSAEKPARRIQPTTILKNNDDIWIQNRQKQKQLQKMRRSLSAQSKEDESDDDDVVEVLPFPSNIQRNVTKPSKKETVTIVEEADHNKSKSSIAEKRETSAIVNGSPSHTDKINNNNNNVSEMPSKGLAESPKNSPEDSCNALTPEYEELISLCRKADSSKDMEKLIQSKLLRYYHGVPSDFVKSRGFRKTVSSATKSIRAEPTQLYLKLKTVIDELDARRKSKMVVIKTEETPSGSGSPATIPAAEDAPAMSITSTGNKRTDEQIKKLNRALYTLTKRIEKLETSDCDWEDDADSAYVQVERFKKRACQIYEKICDLTGESKNARRLIKKPIQFDGTNYPKFNRVLGAFINRTKEFPDFYDVLHVLEHCNTEYNLKLLNFEMKRVAQEAFIKVGKLLQSRRKKELYETVSHFTANSRDPALSDPVLQSKLSENQKHHKRIGEIIDKYARNQDSPSDDGAAESTTNNDAGTSSSVSKNVEPKKPSADDEDEDYDDDDNDDEEEDIEADVETLANGARTLDMSDPESDSESKDTTIDQKVVNEKNSLESDELKGQKERLGSPTVNVNNNISRQKTESKIELSQISNGKSSVVLSISETASDISYKDKTISDKNTANNKPSKVVHPTSLLKAKSTDEVILTATTTTTAIIKEFSIDEIIISDEEEQ